ncbi:MAG: hypothetical protein AAFU79_21890, partial [Myxococcota bacterium]
MSEQRVELDPHPIRDVVAQLLKDGTDEKALFDDDAQKKLSSVVDDYVAQNDHELQPVVRTLIAIFEWLRDDERSPRAAEALKSTFKRPEVIARVEAIEAEMRSQESESRRSEAEQNAQIFGRMAGRSSQV